MKKLLIILLLLQGCAHSDPWTKKDTYRQIAVSVVLATDAYTTSQIQYYNGIWEDGPLARKVLGTQPNTHSTYQYFLINGITNYFIARALPAKWRPYWQGWEVAVHSYATINNCDKLRVC
jgi:hypothetical protein